MKCGNCHREGCLPAIFVLCDECEGAGCALCKDSLIPGIRRVTELPPEGGAIRVCSEWADPEVDAALDDQRPSLIAALTSARDAVIRGD
jgi:hypothetical protein